MSSLLLRSGAAILAVGGLLATAHAATHDGERADTLDSPAAVAGEAAGATAGATAGAGTPAGGAAGSGAARPQAGGAAELPGRVTYGWPIEPADVVRPFDDPAQPWLAGHRGVDLAGSVGVPVRAAADGVVAFAGTVAGRGVVSVDHADGIRTTYEPVTASVVAGQAVAAGDALGTLDAGHGRGSDLHWGARRGRDDYLDPTLLVTGDVVIRLLPLEAG